MVIVCEVDRLTRSISEQTIAENDSTRTIALICFMQIGRGSVEMYQVIWGNRSTAPQQISLS